MKGDSEIRNRLHPFELRLLIDHGPRGDDRDPSHTREQPRFDRYSRTGVSRPITAPVFWRTVEG